MADPIVIVSLPRSGSSMVAGAIAGHGVWTGTCQPADDRNAKGFWENRRIAKLIGETSGHLVHKGTPAPELPDWRAKVTEVVRGDGYTGGPWLWKGSALYAPLWHEFSPVWVVVRRDVSSVERSGAASGRYRANGKSVLAHLEIMDELVRSQHAIEVHAASVVEGDYSGIAEVLSRVGLSLDTAFMDRWVDPTLWRHGG